MAFSSDRLSLAGGGTQIGGGGKQFFYKTEDAVTSVTKSGYFDGQGIAGLFKIGDRLIANQLENIDTTAEAFADTAEVIVLSVSKENDTIAYKEIDKPISITDPPFNAKASVGFDNSLAINKAIVHYFKRDPQASNFLTGHTVRIPKGLFEIHKTVHIPVNGVRLVGDSLDDSTLQLAPDKANLWQIPDYEHSSQHYVAVNAQRAFGPLQSPIVSGAATGGSAEALKDTGENFSAYSSPFITPGRMVINHTQNAWAQITSVDASTVFHTPLVDINGQMGPVWAIGDEYDIANTALGNHNDCENFKITLKASAASGDYIGFRSYDQGNSRFRVEITGYDRDDSNNVAYWQLGRQHLTVGGGVRFEANVPLYIDALPVPNQDGLSTEQMGGNAFDNMRFLDIRLSSREKPRTMPWTNILIDTNAQLSRAKFETIVGHFGQYLVFSSASLDNANTRGVLFENCSWEQSQAESSAGEGDGAIADFYLNIHTGNWQQLTLQNHKFEQQTNANGKIEIRTNNVENITLISPKSNVSSGSAQKFVLCSGNLNSLQWMGMDARRASSVAIGVDIPAAMSVDWESGKGGNDHLPVNASYTRP